MQQLIKKKEKITKIKLYKKIGLLVRKEPTGERMC